MPPGFLHYTAFSSAACAGWVTQNALPRLKNIFMIRGRGETAEVGLIDDRPQTQGSGF
jgi:hypothetical protein